MWTQLWFRAGEKPPQDPPPQADPKRRLSPEAQRRPHFLTMRPCSRMIAW
jgi:hypothetical protein